MNNLEEKIAKLSDEIHEQVLKITPPQYLPLRKYLSNGKAHYIRLNGVSYCGMANVSPSEWDSLSAPKSSEQKKPKGYDVCLNCLEGLYKHHNKRYERNMENGRLDVALEHHHQVFIEYYIEEHGYDGFSKLFRDLLDGYFEKEYPNFFIEAQELTRDEPPRKIRIEKALIMSDGKEGFIPRDLAEDLLEHIRTNPSDENESKVLRIFPRTYDGKEKSEKPKK